MQLFNTLISLVLLPLVALCQSSSRTPSAQSDMIKVEIGGFDLASWTMHGGRAKTPEGKIHCRGKFVDQFNNVAMFGGRCYCRFTATVGSSKKIRCQNYPVADRGVCNVELKRGPSGSVTSCYVH